MSRDPQMNRVYDWENQLLNSAHSDKVDREPMPRSLIKMACRQIAIDAKVEPPVLRWRARLKRRAYYTRSDHAITFPGNVNSWAANILVVLHEMAHAIHGNKRPDNQRQEAHGPEFVRIYIDLIVEHTDFDERFLLDTCRFMGVRVGA